MCAVEQYGPSMHAVITAGQCAVLPGVVETMPQMYTCMHVLGAWLQAHGVELAGCAGCVVLLLA